MRWKQKPEPCPETVQHLMETLGVDAVIAGLLVQREIKTFEEAKKFFRPSLDDLHDPYLMKDMDKAVARIEKAIAAGERIMVFGDYDVDGTTAVSLVSSYLKTYYPDITTYIPDRYDEGYGVSFKGIDYADDNGISLIIALDCGIKSIEHVNYAKARNIDFIIGDHHRPGDELPDAAAVLDPKREDCHYPYDELCGCGIGFKLIQALGQNRGQGIEDLISYLDLAATAIAADIVPMTGENRIMAHFGLKVINDNPRPGIKALVHLLKKDTLDITDVVFIIAPRINAAGRIKHGNHAVELLTEFNFDQAQQFAAEIENYNSERKGLDKQITIEALLQIETNNEKERFSSVVYQEDWHKGVIGIVASRLTETYYRPTLVFTKSGEKYAASARSVKDFDVYNALEACSDYIVQFGGHKYAAGLTLLPEQYDGFKAKFEAVVADTIPEELRIPEISIDAQIELDAITPKFIRILNQFAPFGPLNMAPVFHTKNLYDTGYGKTMGEKDAHIRLYLKQQQQATPDGFAAIGFNLGAKIAQVKDRALFEGIYCIEENHFNNTTTLQLRLKDIR
ncbi:single-stranded-DNA-specific exonuclease RecJ [Flavobacterium kingsejongi]|uniref:Single-stranded-DNA-specific exonuclease RecJ n=1 Tax=Flavobacterium kingsejongi TaxID=1678728 RepID=A0A2S1LK93_9FLAO|nr:single-stranded-DNA-specific exonuclease RecJ [Flavobacterium kingsejongi]AWG24192.1 single-stranded-DNA-specific exonuclease RecJ [Flavobacterium kingsejongi]